MPTIIMSKPASKLDPAIKKKAYAFLEKLGDDDTTLGLHIEPIANSVDARVRTGRVDDSYRAVLFRVPQDQSVVYVFHGIWPHDEAIEVAKKTILKLNPINGIAEIITRPNAAPMESEFELAESIQPSTLPPEPASAQPSVSPLPLPAAYPTESAPRSSDSETPLLASLGITRDELVEELGLDETLAAAALAAPGEDHLLTLLSGAVEWQGLVLLELAAGHPVDEVKEKFSLNPPAVEAEATEDERLLKGLQHPAAQITFAWIESNEELRRVVEGGDFGAWRVFLHPEQRKYVSRNYNGPFRLSGGAGTGKTVVVLHRARQLARANTTARLLVTTFTVNLADQMRTDLARLDPDLQVADQLGEVGVRVSGIDALASAVLKRAGADITIDAETVLGVATAQVTGRTTNAAWQAAIDDAGSPLPEVLRSDAFFAAEYAAVVLPNLITDRQDYFKVRRPGRGVALDRAKRAAVWDVIESYRAKARIEGTIDFTEAAALAAAYCRRVGAIKGEYLADHVLVDEGQDLSPAHWQLLRALVDEGPNDLFIAEDSHQRIYGHRLVLSTYGIKIVGRSQRLTLNYRTTAQNLAWAVRVLEGAQFVDLEDGAEQSTDYRSARSGPPPRQYPCTDLSAELDNAADLVRDWVAANVAPETIAILVRDTVQRDRVVAGLGERGVTVRSLDRGAIKIGQPVALTMHRAKGTEFSRVLLFGVSEGSIPGSLRDQNYSPEAAADAMLRERSLLYVAATRARDELAISWSGAGSEFLTSREAVDGHADSNHQP
jgi:superfamily I DNA/RNA helicase